MLSHTGAHSRTVGDKLSYISLLCFINQSTYGLRTFRIGGAVRELEIQIAHFKAADADCLTVLAIYRRINISCTFPSVGESL